MQGMVDFNERAVNPGEAVRNGEVRHANVGRQQPSRSVTVFYEATGLPPRSQETTSQPEHKKRCLRRRAGQTLWLGLLEAVFVQLVLHLGRQTVVPRGAEPATNQSAPASRTTGESTRWAQLDDVDLIECMLRRMPMLKTCPRFMRGRLRQCCALTFRERGRAKQDGDFVGEVRAWKLFCLVPMVLLHRPRGEGSVGRGQRPVGPTCGRFWGR